MNPPISSSYLLFGWWARHEPNPQSDQTTMIEEVYPIADESLINWMLNLTFRNIGTLYKQSSWGWSSHKKRREITHPDMRSLLIRNPASKATAPAPIAFCNYMFTSEDDIEGNAMAVLYCYELQVEGAFQGTGLGSQLMQRLHEIALTHNNEHKIMMEDSGTVERIMLTVFKSNTKAMKFYRKLGYVVDPISPSQVTHLTAKERAKYDYEIMSFTLPKPPPQ